MDADVVLMVVVVTGVVVLLVAVAAYNGLSALRQDVRDAWGDMDGQLRRRYELLGPLTSAARTAGGPTPPALAAVLEAKNRAAVAFNPAQLADAEADITAGLRELFSGPPPALAAAPAFARARADLLAVDAAIGGAGRRYNDAVHAYNAARVSFPHDAVALAFGFKAQPMFELPPDAGARHPKRAPDVHPGLRRG